MWIQPAAGDAGGAIGAARAGWHHVLGKPRTVDPKRDGKKGSYLGPEYSGEEIESFLKSKGVA